MAPQNLKKIELERIEQAAAIVNARLDALYDDFEDAHSASSKAQIAAQIGPLQDFIDLKARMHTAKNEDERHRAFLQCSWDARKAVLLAEFDGEFSPFVSGVA